MKCRGVVCVLLSLLALGGTMPGSAAGVVDITLRRAYFSEPATVQLMVAVERNDANRTLWIEADGEGMYAASEIQLNGASEKRLHQVVFKSLVAGRYTVRAEVRSSSGVRGMAAREITVIGVGAQ